MCSLTARLDRINHTNVGYNLAQVVESIWHCFYLVGHWHEFSDHAAFLSHCLARSLPLSLSF